MNIMQIFEEVAPQERIAVPYVIAEAGVNHEGSMDIARRLIDEAAEGGAEPYKPFSGGGAQWLNPAWSK